MGGIEKSRNLKRLEPPKLLDGPREQFKAPSSRCIPSRYLSRSLQWSLDSCAEKCIETKGCVGFFLGGTTCILTAATPPSDGCQSKYSWYERKMSTHQPSSIPSDSPSFQPSSMPSSPSSSPSRSPVSKIITYCIVFYPQFSNKPYRHLSQLLLPV